jgi:hypothetical protein
MIQGGDFVNVSIVLFLSYQRNIDLIFVVIAVVATAVSTAGTQS